MTELSRLVLLDIIIDILGKNFTRTYEMRRCLANVTASDGTPHGSQTAAPCMQRRHGVHPTSVYPVFRDSGALQGTLCCTGASDPMTIPQNGIQAAF